ncbi:MAG: hypothetical protein AB7S99_22855 [Pseudodonghicola sp.]
MTTQTAPTAPVAAITTLLQKFAAADPTMLDLIAADIDFRIDHYRDDADTGWQVARSLPELAAVIGRLGQEIFPQGTRALGIDSHALGNGWHLTNFHQRFFYGLQQREVSSLTHILSHESDGKVDYFRETVTNIVAQ